MTDDVNKKIIKKRKRRKKRKKRKGRSSCRICRRKRFWVEFVTVSECIVRGR